jgi:hypothetical protein
MPRPGTIEITCGLMASRKSSFISGSILNGWNVVETNTASVGDQIVGPMSEKAVIASKSQASFSGPFYTVWTESFTYRDDGIIDDDNCDPLFDAVIFGGDNKYFKVSYDIITNSVTAEPALLSDLKKGDLILSLPGYLPNTSSLCKRVSFAGKRSKCVVARISKISKKELVNAPAMSFKFKNAYGVIIDGMAVTKL